MNQAFRPCARDRGPVQLGGFSPRRPWSPTAFQAPSSRSRPAAPSEPIPTRWSGRLVETRVALAAGEAPPSAPLPDDDLLLPPALSFEDAPAPAPPGSPEARRRQAWARMLPERCSRSIRSGVCAAASSWRSSRDHEACRRRRDLQAPPRTGSGLALRGACAAGSVAALVPDEAGTLRGGTAEAAGGLDGGLRVQRAPRPVVTTRAALRCVPWWLAEVVGRGLRGRRGGAGGRPGLPTERRGDASPCTSRAERDGHVAVAADSAGLPLRRALDRLRVLRDRGLREEGRQDHQQQQETRTPEVETAHRRRL